jgi:hypothetical protein
MRPETRGIADAPLFTQLGDDTIRREQYLDFVRCRRFRQTLLCHGDIPVDRVLRKDRLKSLYAASPARLVPPPADAPLEATEEFHGPNGSKVKTAHPLVLNVMHALVDAWPRAIFFQDLPGAQSTSDDLVEIVCSLYSSGLVEMRTASPNIVVVPGERPTASPLARLQAANSRPITTLRHVTIVTTGGIENRLITLLDGTRTREDLFAELSPSLQGEKSPGEYRAELDTSLNTLGKLGLLVS